MLKQKYAEERKARISDRNQFSQELAIKDATIIALQQSIRQQPHQIQPNFGQAAMMQALPMQNMPQQQYPQLTNIPQQSFIQAHIPGPSNGRFSMLKEIDSDESIDVPDRLQKK